MMQIFVLDSNFFIQAHRINYPLDIAVGFWDKVQQLATDGNIISIDKVKNELYNNDDSLKKWCEENLPKDFFKPTEDVIEQYRKVTNWAVSMKNHYLPKAINEFLSYDEADAFLIAYCLAKPDERFIVTQEISEPNKRNKIKIPDCCNVFGITYMNTIEMFRYLQETF